MIETERNKRVCTYQMWAEQSLRIPSSLPTRHNVPQTMSSHIKNGLKSLNCRRNNGDAMRNVQEVTKDNRGAGDGSGGDFKIKASKRDYYRSKEITGDKEKSSPVHRD